MAIEMALRPGPGPAPARRPRPGGGGSDGEDRGLPGWDASRQRFRYSWLEEQIVSRHLTGAQFAEKAGISSQTWSRIRREARALSEESRLKVYMTLASIPRAL